MDSSKFQCVKVNIAFHKTLDNTSKMDAEGESLNICSDFYGLLHLIHPAQAIRFHRGYLLTEQDKVETRERLDRLMVGNISVYLSACFLT